MEKYLKFMKPGVWLFAALVMLSACKNDKYYFDGGKHDATFKGTVLEYLQSKPLQFDTISAIIKISGLEKEFSEDQLTFFAPTDQSVRRIMKITNSYLYESGKDTLTTLEEIEPKVWKKYLMRYMYKGANLVKDYYQLDMTLKAVYPGQNYKSYNQTIFNIGVIFDDINGIKYAGYRHLAISYIPDHNKPLENWVTENISSSDIRPNNGVVHTMNEYHSFGFNSDFTIDVFSAR